MSIIVVTHEMARARKRREKPTPGWHEPIDAESIEAQKGVRAYFNALRLQKAAQDKREDEWWERRLTVGR
jgi:hypothetical protein